MKNKGLICFAASAFVMLVCPFLAVTLAPSDAGMAICFLLFYGVNPLFSAIVGLVSGESVRELWCFPLVNCLMFLIGTWCFFEASEPLFRIYSAVYALISYGVMAIRFFVGKYTKE